MKYLHTMVRVSNVDDSLQFYCDQIGLQEISRVENEAGRFTLIFLAAPGDEAAIARQAGEAREAARSGDWDRLAAAVDAEWQERRELAPGAQPTCRAEVGAGLDPRNTHGVPRCGPANAHGSGRSLRR